MTNIGRSFEPPLADAMQNKSGNLSSGWNWFFRNITDVVQSLGQEKTFALQNDLNAKSFATTDVNTTTDAITEADHNYYTGLVGQFNTTTTLPAGLSLATDYYIIASTTGTYKVASSKANADAGTAINLTSQGTGTHTFTPRGNIDAMKFNYKGVSQATVDFLIQRVTTSTGATELIETGIFVVSYNPTSENWSLTMIGTPGPDDSGIDFTIDSEGQVQYVSTSITGTASISRINWRARTISAKHSSYSTAGTR